MSPQTGDALSRCCNGGLSLRSVPHVRRMFRSVGMSRDIGSIWCTNISNGVFAEDNCLTLAAAIDPWNTLRLLPTTQAAARFSMESIYHPMPIGVHSPWKYHLPSDLKRIL